VVKESAGRWAFE